MSYTMPEAFAADVRLVFQNAIGFNPESHFVHTWAVQLLNEFDVSTSSESSYRLGNSHIFLFKSRGVKLAVVYGSV